MFIAGGSCFSKNSSRCGVVMRISYFKFDEAQKFFAARPVFLIRWTRKPDPSDNQIHSRWICLASSLVGTKIIALKPHFLGDANWLMMGKRKANVLPDPVGAHAIRSRWSSISGMACIWIGVGCLKLLLFKFSFKYGSIWSCSKDTIGQFTSNPSTRMLCWFRNSSWSIFPFLIGKNFLGVCSWQSSLSSLFAFLWNLCLIEH